MVNNNNLILAPVFQKIIHCRNDLNHKIHNLAMFIELICNATLIFIKY